MNVRKILVLEKSRIASLRKIDLINAEIRVHEESIESLELEKDSVRKNIEKTDKLIEKLKEGI